MFWNSQLSRWFSDSLTHHHFLNESVRLNESNECQYTVFQYFRFLSRTIKRDFQSVALQTALYSLYIIVILVVRSFDSSFEPPSRPSLFCASPLVGLPCPAKSMKSTRLHCSFCMCRFPARYLALNGANIHRPGKASVHHSGLWQTMPLHHFLASVMMISRCATRYSANGLEKNLIKFKLSIKSINNHLRHK